MIQALGGDYHVRPLAEEDVAGPYPGWFEDQDVCRYNSHGKFFPGAASFREYVAGLGGQDRIVWAICHAADGHVGNVSLQELSFINRSGEFAIILGDRRHWGKGLGLLAGRAIVAHGFDKLNLERIHCATAAGNLGMQKLATGLGMVLEGTRRRALYLEGAWQDVVEYGVLRDEYRRATA